MTSPAELLLSVQLEQAGIPFEREYLFAKPRRWRSDFLVLAVSPLDPRRIVDWTAQPAVLVEVDGGAFVAGRHSRGLGIEHDAEKQSAAAILGYRVIRATPRQVEDGRALLWVKQALGLAEAA
jgi:hypothetical protein